MGLQIIGYPQSTHVRTALLVAKHHNLAFENVMPEMESATYQHPFGKMPALQDGKFLLFETVAITNYLDALAKAPLRSKDPKVAAIDSQWQSVADDYLYNGVINAYCFQEVKPDPTEAKTIVEKVEKAIVGPFFLGKSVSIADYAIAPCIDFIVQTAPELLKGRKGIATWMEKVRSLESWMATSPE